MDKKRRSIPILQLENIIDNKLSPNPDIENPMIIFGRRRSDAFSVSNDFSDYNNESNDESVKNMRNESLISTEVKMVKLKSFADEVRCKRDIELFVKNARVLLDCQLLDIESIIMKMLSLTGYGHAEYPNNDKIDEVKKLLFADKSKLLTNTMQGIYLSNENPHQFDHSWLCTFCCLPFVAKREVFIARLSHPTNLGLTTHDVRFLILVLAPIKEKMTKSAEETSRAFATIFADLNLRLALLGANDEQQFVNIIENRAMLLVNGYTTDGIEGQDILQRLEPKEKTSLSISFGKGLVENMKRRSQYYISDFVDGFIGEKTIHKSMATTISLYFACLLPCIAFGVLDDKNTNGMIDTRRALIGQTIGGLVFAILGGQPLVIIMTTAPLCLYTKVVYDISNDIQVDFYDMFACVGLWNSFFVTMYSLFDLSVLMKWCTRSTEEIFALFIFFAFSVDAIKDCVKNFEHFYCINKVMNESIERSDNESIDCAQQNSVLFLFLMLATVWLAVLLYDFNKTPYFKAIIREMLADYALPIAVIAFSFVGTYLFRDIDAQTFKFSETFELRNASFNSLTIESIFVAMALGFALSLLFFMDQNISAAMVNNPNNNLKKGSAYHWDLLIVALLNTFLSIFGLPWMHGILPHSPIHARSMADVEQHVQDGHLRQIVIRVRETRVTGLSIHILIGLTLLLIPHPLDYIPVAVLDGLFLYCAVASLRQNSFFERILLFVTEQSAYPPNHYVRRCPQRQIHVFTFIQLIQLAILCFFGFSPWAYVQMAFPVIIAFLIPIRWKIIPLFLDKKHAEAIDGYH